MKMNAYKCHLYSILLVSFTIGMIADKCETPQYLAIGDRGIIACSFQEGFHTALWYNSTYLDEGKSLLQIIDGVKGGTGYYSGEYDICENGSLIINNVTLKHEHNFTVFILKSQDDDPVSLEVEAIVTVTAVPVVDGCNEQSYCVLEVETEGTLKCLLRGIRPKVLLEWKTFLDRDENLISFTNQQFDVNSNGDVYDVMLTSTYQIKNKTKNRITMECRTSGSNIQILQSTTQFDIIFDNGQTSDEPLAPVRSFPLWILVIVLPLCLLALFSCLFFIRRGRRRSQKPKREESEEEEKLSMLSSTVKESQMVLPSPDDTESGQVNNSERLKNVDSGSPVNSSMSNISATPRDSNETSTPKDPNPSVVLIDTIPKFSDPSNWIQKFDIGKEDVGYPSEKVILFVGETGTGKTTMINTMANYLLGNKWDDDYRYQLLSDEEETKSGASQVQSRTQWITSYTFYVENKWRHNFTLIDSPGFGDSRGRERDHTVREQMRVFFTSKGNRGIDHIDGVALVVNASMKRLTVNQKYIFDSVLDLFGKDISDNIFLLCTHATDSELAHRNPDVAESVKKHKISYKELFLFNNEFLYYQKRDCGDLFGLERPRKIWTLGEKTLGQFIDKTFECSPKSLSLSSEVLQERRNLEIMVQSLPNLIKSTIIKMNEVQKEMKIFEEHKDTMETNQSFTYMVQVEKRVREELLNGKKATNCTKCNQTCHYPCGDDILMSVGGVYMCAVMRYLSVFRGCSVCTQNCDAAKHILEPYRYNDIVETETRTKEDMKRKYDVAQSGMQFKEELIQRITAEKNLAQEQVYDTVEKLRKCLGRLDEIALKTKSTSVRELLENLKKQESQAMEPGFEDRVKELHKLCEIERKKYGT